MTLGAYLKVLRKRWRVVVGVMLLTVTAAAVVTLFMPKSYVATSTSFVSIGSAGGDGSDNLNAGSEYALNRVQSYPAMAKSPKVLEPVINDLDLPFTIPQLRKKITATNPVSTVLIVISASDPSADRAADIANEVSDQLGAYIEELETPTGDDSSPVKVTASVPALPPGSPASPRTLLNLAVALVLGAAVGSIVAVIRDQRDTSVKTLVDLRALTGATPLGVIREEPQLSSYPLMMLSGRSGITEDFRSLRTSLRYIDLDRAAPKQIVVSSASPGEGKSVVACNLALVMAQLGLDVCLVEADLRRPRVGENLGIDSSIGLTEVSIGEHRLEEALVSWNRGMLTVLPSGALPPDPTQLLGSLRTAQVLGELRRRFDMVIIDAPALLPVSDAAVLGASSDGVILVARYGKTSRESLRLALDGLTAVGAHVIGTVLTAVPSSRMKSADYYGLRPSIPEELAGAPALEQETQAPIAGEPQPGGAMADRSPSGSGRAQDRLE